MREDGGRGGRSHLRRELRHSRPPERHHRDHRKSAYRPAASTVHGSPLTRKREKEKEKEKVVARTVRRLVHTRVRRTLAVAPGRDLAAAGRDTARQQHNCCERDGARSGT